MTGMSLLHVYVYGLLYMFDRGHYCDVIIFKLNSRGIFVIISSCFSKELGSKIIWNAIVGYLLNLKTDLNEMDFSKVSLCIAK